MATNTLIATGTTATTSADFTIAVGGELDLFLTTGTAVEPIPQSAVILIQKKNGSFYDTMFTLNKDLLSCKLKGAGTWRAKRGELNFAVGLTSET